MALGSGISSAERQGAKWMFFPETSELMDQYVALPSFRENEKSYLQTTS
jgi:hypothetical protein